jgi:sporulation protein YlmC with PRC-barrel domain
MNTFKTIRTLGLAAVAASLPALIAIAAHAQSPAPAPQSAPGAVKVAPPATDMDAMPAKPSSPAASPSAAPPSAAPAGKTAETAPGNSGASTVKDIAVGSAVFGSDGQKLGEIKGVKADPGGRIEEIHVKTGGLLGFGGKIVVIPAAKISKGGQTVQVAMTTEEIGKLPALADKNG